MKVHESKTLREVSIDNKYDDKIILETLQYPFALGTILLGRTTFLLSLGGRYPDVSIQCLAKQEGTLRDLCGFAGPMEMIN